MEFVQTNWEAVGSVVMILVIAYMLLVPTKAERLRRLEAKKIKDRKAIIAARDKGNSKIYDTLVVVTASAERGTSTTYMTLNGNNLITFDGITKGFFSETVYVVLTGDAEIQQYHTEAQAQSQFQLGDYGIVAVTVSKGTVQVRQIHPEKLDESLSYTLGLSLTPITR